MNSEFEVADIIEETMNSFKINGNVIACHVGPIVTSYDYKIAPGIKSSKVLAVSNDIALALHKPSVRCSLESERGVVSFEIPNEVREIVNFSRFSNVPKDMFLPLALGVNVTGNEEKFIDLATAPHLLVSGQTGSGKSLSLAAMILTLLKNKTPDEVNFLMVDPKRVDLSFYEGLPHMLGPVMVDMNLVGPALEEMVTHMEERGKILASKKVRNIADYNNLPDIGKKMPYIVIIIDEFADIMLSKNAKIIEENIQKLAQKSRAAGIHLILGTQRPDRTVCTGTLKSNITTRIAFKVASKTDSRVILDCNGADQLLGKGDLLININGNLTRYHAPYISNEDIQKTVDELRVKPKKFFFF